MMGFVGRSPVSCSFVERSVGLLLNIEASKGETLTDRAVLVVPYTASGGESRINVQYGGIIPIVKISRRGELAHGHASLQYPIKDFGVRSAEDAQKQAEGYLSLARMTEGSPISVVRVENLRDLPLQDAASLAFDRYTTQFLQQNAQSIEALNGAAVTHAQRTMFSLRTLAGWRRTLFDKTITAHHHSIDDEIARAVIALCNPRSTRPVETVNLRPYLS